MRKNILLIDDDTDFINSLLEALKDHADDASVDHASGAKEAIIKLDRQDYNVIVTDYKMPGIDGLAFLDILDTKFPKMARILLTAYADPELISELNRKKILFLKKPCRINDLVRTIDLAMSGLQE